MVMFEKAAGIQKQRYLPTNGGGPAITALLGGHVDVYSRSVGAMIPQVRSGQLRVLGVVDKVESVFLPGVKTLEAQGCNVRISTIWLFVAPAGVPENVAKTLERGAEIDTEYRILRPDGQLRWLHSRGRLHRRVPDGAPLLTGVTQDVTERKRLEEQISASARDWRATFDSLIEPTWILGPDFTIRLGNAAASSFLGLSPEAMVGRPSHHLDGCPQTADKPGSPRAGSSPATCRRSLPRR